MIRGVSGKAVFAGAMLAIMFGFGTRTSAADNKTTAGPGVRSANALVLDARTGEVIFEQDPAHVGPIASITKLMTALVVVDAQQPLDEVIKVTNEDVWKGKGAFSHIPVGTKLTRDDLLRLALMASENRAARVLGRNYPGSLPAFVRAMNVKAKALGMTKTRFDDPSGLSSLNVSNARDLAKLVSAASTDPLIREYSTLYSHEVTLGKRAFVYRNTNLLIGKPDWEILVQKTGYTNDAGQCLVMEAMLDERPVVMVLMNSFGTLTRTADARRIRKWMAAQTTSQIAGVGEIAKK
jgi:serine-type D-Ala-D-Ala endopeptidase (penicillin-binding protein 7)